MDLLNKAEAVDGYRTACSSNELNVIARRGQTYRAFFVKPDLAKRVADLSDRIALLDNTDIVILDPSADGGFPHTRPGIVCLPAGNASSADLETTLIHESIHIHQRENPSMWSSALLKEGWTPVEKSLVPARFRERCRINPDTMATPFWSWENQVPLPLFSSQNPRLSDIVIKWMDMRNGILYSETPTSFTKRYGTPSQPEHPYELLAVEMSAAGINSSDAVERKLGLL